MIRASQRKGLSPQLQLSGSLGCLVPSGAGSQPAKGCGPLLPSWVCGPSEALHGAGCGAQVAPRTCLCLSGDQSPFWSHMQGEDKDGVGQAPAPTRPVKTCAVFLPRTPRALGEPSVTAHMVRPESAGAQRGGGQGALLLSRASAPPWALRPLALREGWRSEATASALLLYHRAKTRRLHLSFLFY